MSGCIKLNEPFSLHKTCVWFLTTLSVVFSENDGLFIIEVIIIFMLYKNNGIS